MTRDGRGLQTEDWEPRCEWLQRQWQTTNDVLTGKQETNRNKPGYLRVGDFKSEKIKFVSLDRTISSMIQGRGMQKVARSIVCWQEINLSKKWKVVRVAIVRWTKTWNASRLRMKAEYANSNLSCSTEIVQDDEDLGDASFISRIYSKKW